MHKMIVLQTEQCFYSVFQINLYSFIQRKVINSFLDFRGLEEKK